MNNNKQTIDTKWGIFGLVILAYMFAVVVRLIWVYQFWDEPSVWWNGQMMLNTNDGYHFASGAQYFLEGYHADNSRITGLWHQGSIWVTVLFASILPFSFETIIFYMPIFMGSLLILPLVLMGALHGKPWWGFFAAIFGVIAWSYYNRTMVGYYDTDMFVVWMPLLALYFLMRYLKSSELQNVLYAGLLFILYAFVYTSSGAVVSGLVIWFGLYALLFHRKLDSLYGALSLLLVVLLPFSKLTAVYDLPWGYLIQALVLVGLCIFVRQTPMRWHQILAIILFVLVLVFGNTMAVILGKISGYLFTGTQTHGLHFFGVTQTVREATSIDMLTLANRIAGSWYGLLIGVAGYGLLVWRYRIFWLLLPLLGAGLFALFGGLRFTIFAVPVIALGGTYLLVWISQRWLKSSLERALFLIIGMFVLLYPNIQHILEYKVPTVMTHEEVVDLDQLRTLANPKDFTLSWWDYGYPLWFYTHTSTLIDGGKHHNDNFILSTILLTTSPQKLSNLARLGVEEYVNFANLMQQSHKTKEAKLYASLGYQDVIDVLLHNKQDSQKDPNLFLDTLAKGTYEMPPKTRDIYLYFPMRMLSIFPVVAQFGNIDLATGNPLREIAFYPTYLAGQNETSMMFHNGLVFDMKKGVLTSGSQPLLVSKFVAVDEMLSVTQWDYPQDGKYIVLLVKSQGIFIILDKQTFDSSFVQMGLLGIYDESLFERVVSSPASQIYRLKH